jgi:hypothetical protein
MKVSKLTFFTATLAKRQNVNHFIGDLSVAVAIVAVSHVKPSTPGEQNL